MDTFTNLLVDGIESGYYQYVRINNNHWSRQSVQDVNSTDMRCGGEMIFPTNASTKAVSAGTTVGFNVEGGLGHPGPLQFYMAQAPTGQNLSSWNGTGDVWFKIAGDAPSVNASGLTWPQQGRHLFVFLQLLTFSRRDNYLCQTSSNSTNRKLPSTRRANRSSRCCSGRWCTNLHSVCPACSQRKRRRRSVAQSFVSRCLQSHRPRHLDAIVLPNVSPGKLLTCKWVWLVTNMIFDRPTNYTMPGPAIWQG